MSPIHGDSEVGLSRQGGPCLSSTRVPQVNTCSRACHRHLPACAIQPSPPSQPRPSICSGLNSGVHSDPLCSSLHPAHQQTPVSSTLKVYPEHASPHPHSLDFHDDGPLCPPSLPGRSSRRPCLSLSGKLASQLPRPPLPTSAPLTAPTARPSQASPSPSPGLC